MSISSTGLGRETPFSLDCPSKSNTILTTYRDAVAKFSLDSTGKLQPTNEQLEANSAVCLLQDQTAFRLILANERCLRVLDESLELVLETAISGDEIFKIVAVGSHQFLTVTDVFEVTCWQAEHSLQPSGRWPVECLPLVALPGGKVVLAAERGRVQERDARNGMVLKTWPKSAPIGWGTIDDNGHHAFLVDESGQTTCWDLSSREELFSLHTDFQVVRVELTPGGLGGALLGSDGQVSLFRITSGGETNPLEVPETPLVALTYVDQTLLGLDENGHLWRLGEETKKLGGSWAGWTTSCLHHSSWGHLVGTAEGFVEYFSSDGSHKVGGLRVHRDAVLALEHYNGGVLSIGADATVCSLTILDGSTSVEQIAEFPGQSVVSHCLDFEGDLLWLGLEEGLVVKIDLSNQNHTEEFRLEGYRIEELRSADLGRIYAITDKGSLKYLS